MIPWQDFDHRPSCWDIGLAVGPYEEYLHFLQNGPNTAELFFKSPMLELAHERRFVVTQLGGDSAGFEDEHTQRIETCLGVLDRHFYQSAGEEVLTPVSTPPSVDSVGLWVSSAVRVKTPTPRDLDPTKSSMQNNPLPTDDLTSSQSAMSQSSHTERGLSIPPRIMENVEFSDDQVDDMVRSFITKKCHRSGRIRQGESFRARKSIRQRRRSPSKALHKAQSFDTDQTAAPDRDVNLGAKPSFSFESPYHNPFLQHDTIYDRLRLSSPTTGTRFGDSSYRTSDLVTDQT